MSALLSSLNTNRERRGIMKANNHKNIDGKSNHGYINSLLIQHGGMIGGGGSNWASGLDPFLTMNVMPMPQFW